MVRHFQPNKLLILHWNHWYILHQYVYGLLGVQQLADEDQHNQKPESQSSTAANVTDKELLSQEIIKQQILVRYLKVCKQ